jgi:hypothetical protein
MPQGCVGGQGKVERAEQWTIAPVLRPFGYLCRTSLRMIGLCRLESNRYHSTFIGRSRALCG